MAIDGTGVMTGTYGDQIYVSFDSVFDLATAEGTGVYVVTGGRGRFQGATGHASLSSSLTPTGFTVVADGTPCF